MPPALEPIPDGHYAEIGTDEHVALVLRSVAGELSRAVVLDDTLNNRRPSREVFCPSDFDTSYVSVVVHERLGAMGLEWVSPHFSPDGCHIVDTKRYIEIYNSSHKQ